MNSKFGSTCWFLLVILTIVPNFCLAERVSTLSGRNPRNFPSIAVPTDPESCQSFAVIRNGASSFSWVDGDPFSYDEMCSAAQQVASDIALERTVAEAVSAQCQPGCYKVGVGACEVLPPAEPGSDQGFAAGCYSTNTNQDLFGATKAARCWVYCVYNPFIMP